MTAALGGRLVRRADEHLEPRLRPRELPPPGRRLPRARPRRHALGPLRPDAERHGARRRQRHLRHRLGRRVGRGDGRPRRPSTACSPTPTATCRRPGATAACYYPRNDTPADADGNRTEIEPMTGNVLLGYARLNVPDGLHVLYQRPWGPEHFAEPALDRGRARRRGQPRRGRSTGCCTPGCAAHRRLDATAVVIGRVPEGARLRIDGQEIDGASASPRWPGHLDVGARPGPRRRARTVTAAPTDVAFYLIDHHGTPVGVRSYRGGLAAGAVRVHVLPRRVPPRVGQADRRARGARTRTSPVRLRPLYVSVDPERDTPEVMRAFLSASYPRFTGLTGTAEQVEAGQARVPCVRPAPRRPRGPRRVRRCRTPRSPTSSTPQGASPATGRTRPTPPASSRV